MAEHLILRIADSADQADMVLVNDDGQLLAQPETVSLTTAAEHASNRQVTVLLPATEIVCCQAELPAANPSRLRQMLPFSLEDEFAADIEELHFAPGARTDDDKLRVSVISRDRLRFWLGALQAAGITARRIVSEADAVPDTPGSTTLFVEGSRILGRRAGSASFQFENLPLPELSQLLEHEAEDSDDLGRFVLCIESASLVARRAEIDQWRASINELEIRELTDGALPHLAATLIAQPGTNLLQGGFASRSDLFAVFRPWRTAAGFLLALVAFSMVSKATEVWKLSRDDTALQTEARNICSASYSSSNLPSCEGEMIRRLASTASGSGGGSGFLEVMSIVGGAAGDALQIENIGYRDGVLVLQVIVPSIPILESFVQGISGAGPYNALPGTTQSVDSGYAVRVEIVQT